MDLLFLLLLLFIVIIIIIINVIIIINICSRRLTSLSVDLSIGWPVLSSASNLSSLRWSVLRLLNCTRKWLRWNKGGSTCWSHSDDQVNKSINKSSM